MRPSSINAERGAKYVHQGEFAVSNDPNEILTAILGSCVSTCLFDPIAGVGGMNHILLPDSPRRGSENHLYGVNLMELLINELMQRGASRGRLQAKLFGGAKVIGGLSDIGKRNVAFAEAFLKDEGITCVGQSVGGTSGRRIRFWPTSGRAKQIYLSAFEAEIEPIRPKRPDPKPVDGDIELF